MLADMEVTAVAVKEFDLGASTSLDQNRINKFEVNASIPIRDTVETMLKKIEANMQC
jgi:hypothetical protein